MPGCPCCASVGVSAHRAMRAHPCVCARARLCRAECRCPWTQRDGRMSAGCDTRAQHTRVCGTPRGSRPGPCPPGCAHRAQHTRLCGTPRGRAAEGRPRPGSRSRGAAPAPARPRSILRPPPSRSRTEPQTAAGPGRAAP